MKPEQSGSREAMVIQVRGAWRSDRLTGATMTELRAANELDKYIIKDPPRDKILQVICHMYSKMDDHDRDHISGVVFNVAGGMDKVGPLSVLELIWRTYVFVAAKDQRVYRDKVQYKKWTKKQIEKYAEREGIWMQHQT